MSQSVTPPTDFDYDYGEQQTILTRAQWHNGNRQLKLVGGVAYTGGLIIEAKYLPEDTAINDFTKTTLMLNRNDVEVFASARTSIAILARRIRYFSGIGEARRNFSHSQYDEAIAQGHHLRGNLQLACYLKGLPSRLVYLSFTGTASREVIAQLKRFNKEALPLTAKKTGDSTQATMPPQAFWLELIPAPFRLEGKSAKQSEVTPPSFNFPETFTREYLLHRYVGKDLLQAFNTEVEKLTEWARAWDTIENDDQKETQAEPQLKQAA